MYGRAPRHVVGRTIQRTYVYDNILFTAAEAEGMTGGGGGGGERGDGGDTHTPTQARM